MITSDCAFDKNGSLWIAYEGSQGVYKQGSLSKYDNGNWTHFTVDSALKSFGSSIEVKCVEIDPRNNVWIGTNKSVAKYKDNDWEFYTKNDGLVHNNTNTIAFDIFGNAWFDTNY